MHIVIGLAVTLVVMWLIYRRTGATRNCRWRADKSGNKGRLCKYRCAACGAVGFTDGDNPPSDCKSKLR